MVSLAVAGFSMDNLSIEKDKDVLKIEGNTPKGDEDVNYVHRGIAGRNFVRYQTISLKCTEGHDWALSVTDGRSRHVASPQPPHL